MRPRLLAALGSVLLAGQAAAQFTQYTSPGSLAIIEAPLREQVAASMEKAPWHLGPVRLLPWIGLRNLTWYSNVYEAPDAEQDDLSATVGAGLNAYLPVGPKVVLVARALPEYVWWKERTEQRMWTGRYGAAVVADLNRFACDALADRTDRQSYLSSELLRPYTERTDRGGLRASVRVSGRIFVYATGSRTNVSILGDAPASLSSLDRTEDLVGGGLRYELSSRTAIEIGHQQTRARFEEAGAARSNTGSAYTLGVTSTHGRINVDAALYSQSLEPEEGASFEPWDGLAGHVTVGFELGRKLEWSLYASRNLVYSLTGSADYYIESIYGGAVSFPLGWRLQGRVFAEGGANDYTSVATGDTYGRSSEGLGLTIPAYRQVGFTVTAWHGNFGPGLVASDRKVWNVQVGLTIGGSSGGW